MWETWIHETRSGNPELRVELASSRWTRRLTGMGDGTHSIRLRALNKDARVLLRDRTLGNKYTLVQRWGDHVAYAGVIQRRRFIDATGELELSTKELRAALFPWRARFGVGDYDPANGQIVIANKTRSGAIRAVVQAVLAPSWEWYLPIDLPSDGSGGYSFTFRDEDQKSWEAMTAEIEAQGCEADWSPYIDGSGGLRWQTRVGAPIATGTATDLKIRGESIVTGLEVVGDYSRQLTGVLGLMDGSGQDTPHRRAPETGSGAGDIPVRDEYVKFTRIKDEALLQGVTNEHYEKRKNPVEQWSFGLNIAKLGPSFAAPGRVLNMHAWDHEFIPDGAYAKRVVALSGDLSDTVTPEVQDG